MSKKSKNVKVNEKLLNVDMEHKFKRSLISIVICILLITLFAVLNILIYAKAAGVGVFSTFSRSVGMLLLFGTVIASVVILRRVIAQLTDAIVEPIRELQAAVHKMKIGEFDIDIQYAGKDELAELADDLRELCDKTKLVVSDAGYLLSEMAEGDFNVSTKEEASYVGEYRALILGMRKLNRQLDGTLREIRMSSQQVMVGADQMAGSAQELAEGATNQASAVEELAATVDNVVQIAEESANNAVFAAKTATSAANDAKKSREEVNQLTKAMDRIMETSKQIENIIGAIEDIADQTNLLALNASIEAARAGEAGRGFAVVADQIGKLASDSAQSAVTTKELIGKSLVEVEAGNSIVEKTMEAINEVLASMESFAGMASGAAEASKTQVDMLKEVGVGIDQITSVVQNNSAAAQETSAVSQELSAQATSLEGMVERFKLRDK